MSGWVLKWNTREESRPRILGTSDSRVPRPSIWSDTCGGFVLCHGDLFDRSELGDPGVSFAALVGAGYERWRDALFDKLRGAFTLAVWDEERRRLVAGRDAMGLSPCYYSWDGRLFLMAASLDALLDQPDVDDRFDRVVIAEYVQDWLSLDQAHETFYQNIRRLPPAHTLTLAGATLSRSRYWDPVPPGFAWASDAILLTVSPRVSRRANGTGSSSRRPASIFEKSRMSLMIASSASPERWTVSA